MELRELVDVVQKDKRILEFGVCRPRFYAGVEFRVVGDPYQSLIIFQTLRWGEVGDYYSEYLYKLELFDCCCLWPSLSRWKIMHLLSTPHSPCTHLLPRIILPGAVTLA